VGTRQILSLPSPQRLYNDQRSFDLIPGEANRELPENPTLHV